MKEGFYLFKNIKAKELNQRINTIQNKNRVPEIVYFKELRA